jgi:hypothetical protein
MIVHWFLLVVLWLIFQTSAPSETPPPLAFSDIVDDEQTYYVYDFETEEITTIPRTARGSVPPTQGGFSVPPAEFQYRSPHDPEVQFVFVDESDPATDILEYEYTLFRLRENGERTLVAPGVNFFLNDHWSQDGQYVYLRADHVVDAGFTTLYQYDVYAKTLTSLLRGRVGLRDCDPFSGWCIAVQFNDDDSRLIYALDKNNGELQQIETLPRAAYFFGWQQDAPEVYYSVPTENERTSIHAYNHETETLNEVASVNIGGTSSHIVPSPDRRWLATVIGIEEENRSLLVVVDAETSDVVFTIDPYRSFYPISEGWLPSSDAIFYAVTDGDEVEIRVTQIPSGLTRILATLEATPDSFFYDHAISPDGWWMALSTLSYREDETVISVLALDGSMPLTPVLIDPPPTENLVCVGWYDDTVYTTGTAYLCDVFLGEG